MIFLKERKVLNAGFFGRTAALLFVLLLTVSYGYAAEISFMAGDVHVIKNGKKQTAQFRMKLDSGDIVKTGKKSFADVSYDDGTVIKVSENSNVTIGTKNAKASDSLSVTSGMISARFAKLEKESARKVYSPTTVCAVRGTEFTVAVSDGADSKVQLTEGAIDLSNPYGKTSITGNQNAEVNIGSAPVGTENANLESWKAENESKLDSNPDEKADAFSDYVKNFQKRSESASSNISDLEKNRGAAVKGGKESLDEMVQKLNKIQVDVEDDMYLSTAANSSIDVILNRYQKDRKDMYDKFLKVKEESNKVMDQQKRNFQEIAAVKESYKKAYDSIINKHKSEMDKIKGSYDKEKVKPKK